MWQIYSLGSLFCGTIEETIDKATIVNQKSIGLLDATWIRNFLFLSISIIGSMLINKELPSMIITIPIIVFGVLCGINAIFYTVLLQRMEITASSLMSNFIPLMFLPIDIFIIGKGFLSRQILGVCVLIIGGIIFYNRKNKLTENTKKHIWIIAGIFFFNVLLFGFESYLFKDLFDKINLDETSFLVSVWGVTLAFLTILLIIRSLGNYVQKVNLSVLVKYSRGSLFSKVADFGNSFFFLKALTTASTSQVSAMQAFYPIMLIFIVFITQKKLRINLEELLDRRTLRIKIVAIAIICVGAILVR